MGAKRAASPSGKRITLTHQSVRAAETLSALTGDPSCALGCPFLSPQPSR